MMKKIISSVLFVLLVSICCSFTTTPAVFAGEKQSVGGKALRGTANVLFGWTEVVQSPANGVRDHGPLGFISGLILFPVKSAIRIVGGAADLITSPVPEKSLVESYPLADL
jgi:putative exosortase-associated protein (TIGR04073 family)